MANSYRNHECFHHPGSRAFMSVVLDNPICSNLRLATAYEPWRTLKMSLEAQANQQPRFSVIPMGEVKTKRSLKNIVKLALF